MEKHGLQVNDHLLVTHQNVMEHLLCGRPDAGSWEHALVFGMLARESENSNSDKRNNFIIIK